MANFLKSYIKCSYTTAKMYVIDIKFQILIL